MNKDQIDELARRLESAHTLTNGGRVALLRDLERYARTDLYGATRLAKNHLSPDAELRLPTVIAAAERIAKDFEDHSPHARPAIDLYGERDLQVRQPKNCEEYRGPIVGATPNCVIQRDNESGDLIVHARQTLSHAPDLENPEASVSITYPFQAVGGVGLVKNADPDKQLDPGEHQHSREHSR